MPKVGRQRDRASMRNIWRGLLPPCHLPRSLARFRVIPCWDKDCAIARSPSLLSYSALRCFHTHLSKTPHVDTPHLSTNPKHGSLPLPLSLPRSPTLNVDNYWRGFPYSCSLLFLLLFSFGVLPPLFILLPSLKSPVFVICPVLIIVRLSTLDLVYLRALSAPHLTASLRHLHPHPHHNVDRSERGRGG